jgi:hypothetical protein
MQLVITVYCKYCYGTGPRAGLEDFEEGFGLLIGYASSEVGMSKSLALVWRM